MLRITFNRLSTKVLGNLAQWVLNVLSHHAEGILKSNPLVAVLISADEGYPNVVIKKTFSELRDKVRNPDLLRDRLFYNFRRNLSSLTFINSIIKLI